MNKNITCQIKSFKELTLEELYNILKLREEVFIREQTCNYTDIDGADFHTLHLLMYDNEELIGYARIFGPNTLHKNKASFGRVLIRKSHRKKMLGHYLIEQIEKNIEANYGLVDIEISAQAYLQDFYKHHRYIPFGEVYLDAGVPHIGMIKRNLI